MSDNGQKEREPSHKIVLTLDGPTDEGGHVRLPVFINGIKALSDALKKLDRHISKGPRTSYVRIVGLSHSSPATIEVEVCRRRRAVDNRAALVATYYETAEHVVRGEFPPDLDIDVLEDFRSLVRPIVKKDLANAHLAVGDRHLSLAGDFVFNIEKYLSGGETASGSIEGRLEQINIHGGANTFRIYPEFGPSFVSCHFPMGRRDEAIAAIGFRVLVTGKLVYRPGQPYPHTVEVEEIDIYPPEADLPTFEELRGIAKDATGEKLSEEFIAEKRDAWR